MKETLKEYNVLRVMFTRVLEEPSRSTINMVVSMMCNNRFGVRTTTVFKNEFRTCSWVMDKALLPEQIEELEESIFELIDETDNKVLKIEQSYQKDYKLF